MTMKKKRQLIIWSVILLASCTKVTQEFDTAVLTERTNALISLFLDNTRQWRDGNELLSVTGWKDEKEPGFFYLNICADDTAFFEPYGDCKGIAHLKGNRILLFGDSWNNYFWSSDTTFYIPDANRHPEDEFVFYDPTEWIICVRNDTSISEAHSSLPWDNLSLLDSIENIIRK